MSRVMRIRRSQKDKTKTHKKIGKQKYWVTNKTAKKLIKQNL